MGRHRTPRQDGRIAQSDEAKALLKDDRPQAVKMQLRLALKGGRQQRRRCLGCRKPGIHCKVWAPAGVWGVEARDTTGIRVYWLCQRCNEAYADGLPPDLERRRRG